MQHLKGSRTPVLYMGRKRLNKELKPRRKLGGRIWRVKKIT